MSHLLWQYLNQQIFNAQSASVWHPGLFWYMYRVQLLESCWRKNTSSQSHSPQ